MRSFIQNIGHIGRGRPHEKTTLLRVVSGVFWELRSQCIEKQSNYLSIVGSLFVHTYYLGKEDILFILTYL